LTLLTALPTVAGVAYRVDFDHAALGTPGQKPLGTGGNDFIKGGGTFVPDNASNVTIVASDAKAFQGGKALKNIFAGTVDPNKGDGYRIVGSTGSFTMVPATGFTIEMVLKFEAQPGWDGMPILTGGWQFYPGIFVERESGQDTKVAFYTGLPGAHRLWTGLVPLVGTGWHHLAVTAKSADGGVTITKKIFIDGVEKASETITWGVGNRAVNINDTNTGSGQYIHQPGPAGLWIDAAAMSDTALTPATFVLPTKAPTRGMAVMVR
jgi:hypothetical protein